MIAALLHHILRAFANLDRWLWRDVDAEIRAEQIYADEYDGMARRRR
jgi:N12 class adenine-specific DNA methylase